MKIRSLQLKNFKRFTDLTLQDIPENAKLVLLIGSNGSGKSSVFDGFEAINKKHLHDEDLYLNEFIRHYYRKDITNDFEIKFKMYGYDEDQFLTSTSSSIIIANNSFYGRTSFRQASRLTRKGTNGNISIELDNDRPRYFIDKDERFENDVEVIAQEILKEVFRTNKTTNQIREKYISPINNAFENIFKTDDYSVLKIVEITPPLDGKVAQIIFSKGTSEFPYDFLSAGEKEIFNILLNLLARRSFHQNSIFFFDEIDLHLNTKLQYDFLKEIVENWIPENCQLWTASHSLGFIDYANDNDNACIIDFDDFDFDQPKILLPQPKNNFEIFELAVSKTFIDKVVQGRKIIFSENTDTPFYNDLNITNIFFFIAIDKNDVFHKARNHKQHGLIDRDFLSDEEINALKNQYPYIYILPYYSIENLFYHPDNVAEYSIGRQLAFNKQDYINEITSAKNNDKDYIAAGIVQARSGYPFYKENENNKKLKEFKENYKSVIDLLRSDDFEIFYKVYPAKYYGRELIQRQNIPKVELAKTEWFRHQIELLIVN